MDKNWKVFNYSDKEEKIVGEIASEEEIKSGVIVAVHRINLNYFEYPLLARTGANAQGMVLNLRSREGGSETNFCPIFYLPKRNFKSGLEQIQGGRLADFKPTLMTHYRYPLVGPSKFGLFLDRDGVLNRDTKYLSNTKDLEIFPHIVPSIKKANHLKIPVIVVTNQAGIARGKFDSNQLQAIHRKLESEFNSLNVRFDGIYFCPYHTEGIEPWKRDSVYRKPNPGMGILASSHFHLNWRKGIMVGDKDSDRLVPQKGRNLIIQGDYPLNPGLGPVFHDWEKLNQELSQLLEV